jgi:2,3-bisphosphoglycerate-dependent phosphoglycerate mutase
MSLAPLPDFATAWLVRHGQSLANAGGATRDFKAIPLTELGREQAQIFAERFVEQFGGPPSLIVHSPYLRAVDTAKPTITRFRPVPVEIWPIQEFTYLNPATADGLTERERGPLYTGYWERDDPGYCDGGGTESFTHFLNRVRTMLSRLAALPRGERVVLFTHGYLMQAVRLLVLFPGLTDREMMSRSRILNDAVPIQNTEILELQISGGKVAALEQEHITPLTLEGVISHE